MRILSILPAALCWASADAHAAPLAQLDVPRITQQASGLRPEVLRGALDSATCASEAFTKDARTLTIVDYSLPSTQRRMWVVDLETGRVLFHELVAHGSNTGQDRAESFSNEEGSHQSSLGLFRTAEPYVGKHGLSLRLDGLDPGFNDRARKRAIVVHGADYATESFVEAHGRLGRSWGCPAVDPSVSKSIIETIANGSIFFAWYPDTEWLEGSEVLHCDR